MASLDLTSWPQMRSGFENPFQNAPGRFIPALPNLASHCWSISSDNAISDCLLACPFAPFDDEHYHHQSCYSHNPPKAPPHSPAEAVGTTGPLAEDMNPEDLIRNDDDDHDDDSDSDSDDTCSSSQHPREQQSSSGSSTLTPSRMPSSPTSSRESFDEDQEEEAEAEAKDSPLKVKGRRKRKSSQGACHRCRNRQIVERNRCVMGLRAMGIPGIQIQVWLQHSQPQPHPVHSHTHVQLVPALLPSTMPGVGHAHVLFPPATAYCGFVVSRLLPPQSHVALPVTGFFVG